MYYENREIFDRFSMTIKGYNLQLDHTEITKVNPALFATNYSRHTVRSKEFYDATDHMQFDMPVSTLRGKGVCNSAPPFAEKKIQVKPCEGKRKYIEKVPRMISPKDQRPKNSSVFDVDDFLLKLHEDTKTEFHQNLLQIDELWSNSANVPELMKGAHPRPKNAAADALYGLRINDVPRRVERSIVNLIDDPNKQIISKLQYKAQRMPGTSDPPIGTDTNDDKLRMMKPLPGVNRLHYLLPEVVLDHI